MSAYFNTFVRADVAATGDGRTPAAARLTLIMGCLGWLLLTAGCSPREKAEVIVYTSQDQNFAEPILREFTRQTQIEVRPVYDSEAVKTVGLANRLLAEREHPQCDLYWSSEELRTRQLAAQGVFRETDGWKPVGYRLRRLVINTNHLSAATAPKSLLELTNAVWKGKIALAYPLFGTTAVHFAVLRQAWGDAGWQAWCQGLLSNKPLVVDGNSVVIKLVAKGEVWMGLTDSDDIRGGRREGLPVEGVDLKETLVIPNTLAVMRNARHAAAAQQLYEYLQRPEVLGKLVTDDALEGVKPPNALGVTPHWDGLLRDLESTMEKLKTFFLRQG